MTMGVCVAWLLGSENPRRIDAFDGKGYTRWTWLLNKRRLGADGHSI